MYPSDGVLSKSWLILDKTSIRMKRVLTDKNSAVGDCPKCWKPAIWYKVLGVSKDGKVPAFHYFCKCENCNSSRAYPRDKYGYELLKDKDWNYSKNYLKLKLNGDINYKIPI